MAHIERLTITLPADMANLVTPAAARRNHIVRVLHGSRDIASIVDDGGFAL